MDPLSALSVAANIVQFVDYGISIVSKGNQLYKSADEALVENVELEGATVRLQQPSNTLQQSLEQGLPQNSLDQSDKALQRICEECRVVSQELVDKLEKLKVPENHHHKKWKSFRQALKSVSSKQKIEETKERLSSLRIELDSHVLISLRKQVTYLSIQQNARFNSLDIEAKKVMMALLANNEALLAGIEKNFNVLSLSRKEDHAKMMEMLKNQAEGRNQRRAELQILESLRFQTMTYRYDTISEAHQRTFGWIFQDPAAGDKPWSSFIEWAESGRGIYWINGKAGSGKSTLMRFIVDDPRTQAHLERWAPKEALDTPSFFFWNSGVPEQRSQMGLLRSIIYEVLQKHTDLIPMVYPDEWRKTLELSRHDVSAVPETWSLARLHKAFKRLVGCASEKLRFCFFIDGLDEYDGNHEEIAEHFSEISCSTYVKFCIASRPLIVFKDVFSCCPALRLQDLTSDDIERYINDKLKGHKRMQLLTLKEPIATTTLIREIICHAEGVFLWVTLVVKSLLRGLGQRDAITQLLKRLNAFPSDLDLLYGHMLSSIDPIYIEEGMRFFQIFMEGQRMLGRYTVESLYTSHSVDLQRVLGTARDDLRLARNEEVELRDLTLFHPEAGDFSIYVPESLHNYMDHIVRTRCGGLIECGSNHWIQYLHRTVSDYLHREVIWKDICRHNTQLSVFNPKLQALMSKILLLKRLSLFEKRESEQVVSAIQNEWSNIQILASVGFNYDPSNEPNIKIWYRLLDEFDRIGTDLSQNDDSLEAEKSSWSHWSSMNTFPQAWQSDFLCETTRIGMVSYIENRVSCGASIHRVLGLPLLGFAFLPNDFDTFNSENINILAFLLEQGADANQIFEGYTMWQYFIHYLHAFHLNRGRYKRVIFKKLVESFIKSGVDLDVCCIADDSVWSRVYSYDPPDSLSRFLRYTKSDLEEHVSPSAKTNTARFKRAPKANSVSSISTPSTESPSSSGQEEPDEPDADSVNESEEAALEEYHSLAAVIKDCFATVDDPNGADELLELIATLKAAKQASEGMQS